MAAKKRRTKKVTKRRVSKPIGFTKQGKSYRLVFGTKKNPRVGSKVFRTKKSLVAAARKRLK
jgi:hypothetical protein